MNVHPLHHVPRSAVSDDWTLVGVLQGHSLFFEHAAAAAIRYQKQKK